MSVQDLIEEGVALFKNKKFDEAIEKLKQALGKIEQQDIFSNKVFLLITWSSVSQFSDDLLRFPYHTCPRIA